MSAVAPAPAQRTQSWGWMVTMVGAGVLQAASLAWPSNGQPLWWLQLLSLSVLCVGVQRARSAKQVAWLAGLFATTWLTATFWWLFISMHTYGGLPAPLAVVAVLALAAFLGSYYAVALWLWKRWARPGWHAVMLFAACWTLAELARGTLWTGFPWGAVGYAHVEGPLSVWPRWFGVYGTGLVAAALAMGVAQLRILWSQKLLLVGVGLVGGSVWLGAGWSQQQAQMSDSTQSPVRPAVTVALLQGNIAQDEKFIPGSGVEQALQWYGERLLHPQAELVVAPETAIPLLPQQLPAGYWEAISAPYRQPQSASAALVGIPLGNEVRGYSNAVVGWMPGEMPEYRYDKHHLVPFGEFIPPMFQWFVRMMNIPLGDFSRGSVGQAPFVWRGERWAPNICYEDLFGEELGARFADVSKAPTVFVNVSNIGWFGDSIAVDQHLQISRMRALEFERPMLRATNTGATAVIDHRGVVQAALQPYTRDVLLAQVHGRDGITPFARWVSHWGLWPLWLFCVVVVAWCAKQRKKI